MAPLTLQDKENIRIAYNELIAQGVKPTNAMLEVANQTGRSYTTVRRVCGIKPQEITQTPKPNPIRTLPNGMQVDFSDVLRQLNELTAQVQRVTNKTTEAQSNFDPSHVVVNPYEKEVRIGIESDNTLEIFASDIHFPYEDHAAYALFLEVLKEQKPNILFLGGDVLDCYAVSAHDKDPNRATPAAFKGEIAYAREKLTELRQILPDAKIYFKQGNHESRLDRYLRTHASALADLEELSLPSLLKLDTLNIKWIPNEQKFRIGKLWHLHGNEVAGSGQSVARLKFMRTLANIIFGHHHQKDDFVVRTYEESNKGAYANPCLCSLDVEYIHHPHTWSLGFSEIRYSKVGNFQVQQTIIIKDNSQSPRASCLSNGKHYEVDIRK